MNNIIDLDNFTSFSSAVNTLQDDKDLAKLSLELLSKELDKANKDYEDLVLKLSNAKGHKSLVESSIKNVLKAMKFETPFHIVLEDKIIKFSDNKIEKTENFI